MNETKHKNCSVCKESKPLSEFSKKSDAKDGLHSYCFLCKTRYERRRVKLKKDLDWKQKVKALKGRIDGPDKVDSIKAELRVIWITKQNIGHTEFMNKYSNTLDNIISRLGGITESNKTKGVFNQKVDDMKEQAWNLLGVNYDSCDVVERSEAARMRYKFKTQEA